ncbi:phosphoenolpyruvate carboxykinase (ATP) [Tumebacillus permanentifrigoris]|uniref:Phosphoenolpyruvate carboxykinase (ATP) n=1 Tax=Tumebacillus permanentifrigoris TaxID=378543 RepID=A0A316D593_9BACL|nr:phosphoenolpyruvate carboxykinase (ATP) [Tumebacillus permanentifrigoris]PWK08452.1 phosphoenolpyruvate carboxykinase (ATP) [Tumebacillus permanentifrigoris]
MTTKTATTDLQTILDNTTVHYNLSVPMLVEEAVKRGEAILSNTGALSVTTGKYTGRSPKDKFIVRDAITENQVAWGPVNAPFEQAKFDRLYNKALEYLKTKQELFVFDGFAGADVEYRLPIRVVNEYAWQNQFVHQLFIRPTEAELKDHLPQFTVIGVPNCVADPAVDGTNSETYILISFEKRVVLIGGTHYAGEMKKSIFSVMNFLLPGRGVMPMHCSANIGQAGDVALFFGLSGTGKTTLSADPNRQLIGDDEHGWSDNGVFNFEGGCYAKTIKLSAAGEPEIWNAIRFGTVLENVVVDQETGAADYDSAALTENTRAAYPLDFIPGAVFPSVGGHPNVIVFLTADATGTLPPIAQLTKEQAMYYFLSGYTSKLAGTERGVTEPEATFSTCFGAPFLPLQPTVYAELLGKKIEEHNSKVYLVNTGWTGGAYGTGSRMKLSYTRAMVTAAIEGRLGEVEFVTDPIFGLSIPTAVKGVPAHVLNPRNTWEDKAAYDQAALGLAGRFVKNFEKFGSVSEAIKSAAPRTAL